MYYTSNTALCRLKTLYGNMAWYVFVNEWTQVNAEQLLTMLAGYNSSTVGQGPTFVFVF